MPDLPSGTVTFLFTDIEGSTALWERDPVAMVIAVARHLTLLWAATEAHNGVCSSTWSVMPCAPRFRPRQLRLVRHMPLEPMGRSKVKLTKFLVRHQRKISAL